MSLALAELWDVWQNGVACKSIRPAIDICKAKWCSSSAGVGQSELTFYNKVWFLLAHIQNTVENGDKELKGISDEWKKWCDNITKKRCRTVLKFVEKRKDHWNLTDIDSRTFREKRAKKF